MANPTKKRKEGAVIGNALLLQQVPLQPGESQFNRKFEVECLGCKRLYVTNPKRYRKQCRNCYLSKARSLHLGVTVRQWADALGLTYTTCRQRIHCGCPLPSRECNYHTWQGYRGSTTDWSKVLGVSPQAVESRLRSANPRLILEDELPFLPSAIFPHLHKSKLHIDFSSIPSSDLIRCLDTNDTSYWSVTPPSPCQPTQAFPCLRCVLEEAIYRQLDMSPYLSLLPLLSPSPKAYPIQPPETPQ